MPLMNHPEICAKFFGQKSAPSRSTFNRWVLRREIPGMKIAGKVLAYSEFFEAAGNPIVAKVLIDVSRAA